MASALAPYSAAAGDEKQDKPNIVLIVADDMGWSDAGCYGGVINTPNIDSLASDGLRFNQFYVNPVCAPSRAALMTGLYPRNHKGSTSVLTPNMVTVAQALRSAGYRTSISGKWNCQRQKPDTPLAWGFEEFYGFPDMPSNYFNPALEDMKFGGFRPPFEHNGEEIWEFPDDFYVTDAINDHAVDMIKHYSESSEPFFAYVAHLAPHNPLQARPEDIEKYRGKFMDGWDVLRRECHQRQVDMGLVDPEWGMLDYGDIPNTAPWVDTEHKEWQDLRMAVYAAMIDSMDQGIGRILSTLKDCGVDRNTIVLFLSDNGGDAGNMRWDSPDIPPGGVDTYCAVGPEWGVMHNTPLRASKGAVYEGGIATPLIVRWHEAIQNGGGITNQVGHVMDLLPTFCDVAGIQYPDEYNGEEIIPCEGLSLLPIFEGKQRDAYEWLFWEHSGKKAVRHGDWKLVGSGDPANWELYDLESDRSELRNLAENEPDRVKLMAQAWSDWAARTNG